MKSNTSKLFAWIIVFLLVIGLAGFGIQDIISGSGRSNIAIVGKKKIKPEHLVKAIQQEIVILSNKLNTNLSFQEADQLGVSKLAFQKILLNSILNEKSRELRISISDENSNVYKLK